MRTLCVLAALVISPLAVAQDNACSDSATFSARRCAAAVTEATQKVETASLAIEQLNGCTDIKKKKDLIACTEQLATASRRLVRGSQVLLAAAAAAAEAPAAAPPATPTMQRPE